MIDNSTINFLNAGYFSALAYATPGVDAFVYGANGTPVEQQAALALSSSQWTDQTALLTAGLHVSSTDQGKFNGFRVFVNTHSHEIVFAFKGSSLNANNWLSDVLTQDQGATQYAAIAAAANAVYAELTSPLSIYGSYTFYADGHSLGGGMAQTFALQNDISGFGQNALPIAPASLINSSYFPGGATNALSLYADSGATFQDLNMQGEIASIIYHSDATGGYYLDPGLTTWVYNPRAATEYALAQEWAATPTNPFTLGLKTGITLNLLYDAGGAHTLGQLIPASYGPNGLGATPDSPAMQSAIGAVFAPLVSAINSGGITVNPNGHISGLPGFLGFLNSIGSASPGNGSSEGEATVAATVMGQAPVDVVAGSATQASAISAANGTTTGINVLIGAGGPTLMDGGANTSVFLGGTGNTTMYGANGAADDAYVYDNVLGAANTTETIVDPGAADQLWVGAIQLTGTPTAGAEFQWSEDGTNYQFTPGADYATSGLGTMAISGGALGADDGDQIDIQGFNLTDASFNPNGFMGLNFAPTLSLVSGANTGVDPPGASFIEGNTQSYTIAIDSPDPEALTVAVTLSGAEPSDFEVATGNTLESIGAGGTFDITIAAGSTSAAFSLIDDTDDNGSSDIAGGNTLQLSASIPNPLSGGAAIDSENVSVAYVPTSWNTDAETVPGDTLTATDGSFFGDGQNDDVIMTPTNNNAQLLDSGNDSVTGDAGNDTVFGGQGNDIIAGGGGQDDILLQGGDSEIYANSKTSLAAAIANAASATATGAQGDFIGVLDGDNTIVGSNGNDLITAGAGNDVVVLGPGNDIFQGGWDSVSLTGAWSASVVGTGVNISVQISNVLDVPEAFTNTNPQPYNGPVGDFEENGQETITPYGIGNSTVFGGTGNDVIYLGNGDNYVDVGSGNSTVAGGMGDDTIIGGSGSEFIKGGGGSTYIAGGSGTATIYGGDGNNTIIGGSGNETIASGTYYDTVSGSYLTQFAGANLDQNYVTGGSGNDVIYGSAGQDTLDAGTGNTTIYGGTGTEDIIGGPGNDVLVSGLGNETISAGTGNDTLQGSTSATAVTILYGGSGTDLINGGDGTDTLYAGDGGTAGSATSVYAYESDTAAQTTIYGGAGVQLLEGGSGSTLIYGGDGGTESAPVSIFAYGGGHDTFYGGLGTDLIEGGSGTNVLYAGSGGTASSPTSVDGGAGASTLYGGGGDSELQDTVAGDDLLVSQTGDDTLTGIGIDTLIAGSGTDVFDIDGGSVTVDLTAGSGNDSVYTSNGGTANLVIPAGVKLSDVTGSIGADTAGNWYFGLEDDGTSAAVAGGLTGSLQSVSYTDTGPVALGTLLDDAFGTDQVVSNGSNTFALQLGNSESVTGSAGNTTVSSWGTNDTIVGFGSSLAYGAIYSEGNSASISSSGFDSIKSAGSDAVISSSYLDRVTVSGANSLVTTGVGYESITASGSNDTLEGGAAYVTFYVNDGSTVIQAPGGGGVDTIVSSVTYTAPSNVNILTLTGAANISATGNTGSDTLTGGAGADTLAAGSGLATLIGGSGNTTFVVNATGDVVSDGYGAAVNVLDSSVNYSLPGDVNTLVLSGTANLVGTANSGADTLTSNTGVDTLIGGSGNDTFILNNPNDVVEPGSGTKTILFGYGASYTVPTGVTSLTLTGSANVAVTANSGNESLVSNSGIDTLTGGAGNDTFVVNNMADVVGDTATSTTNVLQSTVSYSLPTNVNTLILLGSVAISGTGNSASNVITANSGADTLFAGAGIATLVAGSGNDTFVVDNTADVVTDTYTTTSNSTESSVNYSLVTNVNSLILTGTANLVGTANSAADTLTTNSGLDTLVGGSGPDTFVVSNSADVIEDTATGVNNVVESSASYVLPVNVNTIVLTGTGNIEATSNTGNNSLVGGAGLDTLVATSGQDTLMAGSGSTTLVGGTGSDLFVLDNTGDVVTVSGNHGANTIESSVSYTLPSGASTLILTGTAALIGAAVAGNNSLMGNAGADTLSAGSGADTLIAGSGVSTLVGGNGTDTFVINNAADVLASISGANGNTVVSSISYTMPTGISNLVLSGTADIVGTGNSGNDTLRGGAGNDTLIAGSGLASLFGGSGADLFVINSTGDVVTEQTAKPGVDTIDSSVSYTLPNTVNDLLLTGTNALSATGNIAGPDLIVGNAGTDSLIAGTGNDTLVAGSGVTTLIGGIGNDTFVVNTTSDVVEDNTGTTNNVLRTSASYSLPANVNTLILTGSAALLASANSGADFLFGNAGADTLVAGAGQDTLHGGSGVDTFIAGTGGDVFFVTNSADLIQGATSGVTYSVISASSFSLPTNINVLTLEGSANSTAQGNSGADILTGAAGNDTLIAGSGPDTLYGGSGNTTFVVDSTGDVVQDTFIATTNTLESSVSYSLPTNVNVLILTGTANLAAAANSGNDTLSDNGAVDTLTGGAGNDTFVVSNAGDIIVDTSITASNIVESSVSYSLATNINTLILTGTAAVIGNANASADTLVSNSSMDTLVGGGGNDTFVVNNTGDVVQDSFGSTNNTLQSYVSYSLPANVNRLTLEGTASLVATGNSGNDVLAGNSGNDTLVSGSGPTTLTGGSGLDTFVVNNTADAVSGIAADTVESSVNFTLPASVATLALLGTGNLVASAGATNDTLVSNSGVDTLVGSGGHEVYIINNSADVLQGLSSTDTVESNVNYTLPAGASRLVLLGTAALVGTGGAAADTITANSGSDTLTAGSGLGVLIGGAGNDTFVVNNSSDVIEDGNSQTSNSVVSSVSYSLPTNVDTLILTGSAALLATGNLDFSNVLTANSGADQLVATAEVTTLNGGAGADTLFGGSGYNVIYGGAGTTVIDAGDGTNVIYAGSGPTRIYGNQPGTSLYTQTTMYGGSGTDVLQGGPGSDLIFAGSGADTLYSGTGYDVLYGGGGDQLIDSASSGTAVLDAGSGAETLSGSGGDTLKAGSGPDLLEIAVDTVAGGTYQFGPGFGTETIGNGAANNETLASSQNDTLDFLSGISPGALSVSESIVGNYFSQYGTALVINDGSGSILVNGGLVPGVISSVVLPGIGTESLDQFMRSYGPGTVSQTHITEVSILSTGDNTTLSPTLGGAIISAFGNNDTITDTWNTQPSLIVSYGSGASISGYELDAEGNSDSITLKGGYATVGGGNDTLSVVSGNADIRVLQSSDIIDGATVGSNDSIDALANFTLPTNIASLTLDSAVGSLSGYSNAVGGLLTAAANNDTLTGGAGNDTLSAKSTNDVLVGGSGIETYVLGSASDSIQYGSGAAALNTVEAAFSYTLGTGANTLIETAVGYAATGNSANDSLVAQGQYDTVVAGSGNDTLVNASTNYAVMIGGAGNDTFVVKNAADVVEDTSATANNAVYSAVSFSLITDINSLTLTGNANLVGTANSANDYLAGNGGNDTLISGTGNDTLVAGAGVDTIVFNSGFGNDVVENVNGGDVIEFGSGVSQSSLTFTALPGSAGSAPSLKISSGTGSITVQGGLVPGAVSSVQFVGGASNTIPQLVAPSGRVTISGTGGNLILSPSNSDSVLGGSGQDTVVAWGNSDTLAAGTGGAEIYAGGAGTRLTGSAVADTLSASGSADTLIGGTGTETFIVGNTSDIVQVSSSVNNDTIVSSVNYSLPTNVSVLTLIGTASVQATGNAGADTLTANSGADTLTAGIGLATLVGGSGFDTFVVDNSADVIQAQAGNTVGFVDALASYTMPLGMSAMDLNAGYIVGTGNSQANYLYANQYGDTLVAGSGNETLISNSQEDTLVGGTGNDYLSSTDGFSSLLSGTGVDTLSSTYEYDTLVINNSQDFISDIGEYDAISSSVSYTIPNSQNMSFGGTALNWTLTGTGNISATYGGSRAGYIGGNSGNDTLTATSNSDTLRAGSGADVLIAQGLHTDLFSGTGVDTLIAQASYTTFGVGNTADVIEVQSGTNDTLDAGASYSLPAYIDTLVLDASSIVGVGNSDNDTLYGYYQDTLVAGSGNDLFVSDGADTFVAGSGNDTINSTVYGNGDVIVLNSGHGNTQVYEPYGATIEFGSGITAASLTASAVLDANNQGALAISGSGGTITLGGALAGIPYQFDFAGGPSLDLGQFLAQVNVTTSSVSGGSGNLSLVGGSSVSIAGGSGNDTIFAAGANDTLTAGTGNQVLYAAGINDSVIGGAVADTLGGLGSGDTLVAGSAVDTLIGGSGATVAFVVNNTADVIQLQTNPGSDTVVSASSFTLPTNVNSLLLTGTAALVGTANSGNDTLTSNSGLDTLVGGAGSDTFVLNNTGDVIQDTTTGVSNAIVAGFSYTLPTNINTLVLTGTAALMGVANGGADSLVSNAGVDTLVGGAGNDTFVLNNSADVIQDTATSTTNSLQTSFSYSLPGNINTLTLLGTANLSGTANGGTDTITSNNGIDTLTGGAGNDTFVINNSADTVLDSNTTASNAIQTGVSYSLPTNVNSLTLTGSANITGAANAANDTLGTNGGIDTLIGGPGYDVFVVTNSADVIIESATNGGNLVESTVSYSLPANVNALVFTGGSALTAIANGGADTLTANSGPDTLIGGAGNDTFVISSTADVVVDTYTTTSNTLSTSISYTLPSNINTLVLNEFSYLQGQGNSGNDTLVTNATADSLIAGAGNDSLVANAALDTLIGGAGTDTFVGAGSQDTFILTNTADVVTDSYGGGAVQAGFSYSLPTGVEFLQLTGTAALTGTGNGSYSVLQSNSGADTLNSGGGFAQFYLNNTADVVQGSGSVFAPFSYTLPTGVDGLVLEGTANLMGVANSDQGVGLESNTGIDTLVGGADFDTFFLQNSADVLLNLSADDTIETEFTYSLPNTANNLDLFAAGTVGRGNSNNDYLTAENTTDTLYAGSGTDTLDGGDSDVLIGSSGNDTFVIEDTGVTVTDTVTTTSNTALAYVSYTLPTHVNTLILDLGDGVGGLVGKANSGNDSLLADDPADTLTAGSGADTLEGTTATDVLVGGSGNDTFIVDDSAITVTDTSTTATNTLETSLSYTLPTHVNALVLTGTNALQGTANSANDSLTANAGSDTLVAGSGTDTLISGASGSDSLAGGSGNDTFIINSTADIVTDTSTTASNAIRAAVNYSLPTNVNTLVLTGTAALQGIGNSHADSITANSGADTLTAGAGVVTFTGGGGNDTFVVNNTSDVITDTFTATTNTLSSSVTFSLPTHVNVLILTGTFALKGTANTGNDSLTANSGSDTLVAGSGVDTLITGAAGTDSLVGGSGNDTFVVNSTADVITDTFTATTNTLVSSVSYTLPTNVNVLVLTGTAALAGTGNAHTDSITANSGADTLTAGSAVATMVGGAGNDTFVVNNTGDVVTDTFAATSNTISSSVNYSLVANVNSLILSGTSALKGTANSGSDTLTANTGADTLVGGAGNDTFVVTSTANVVSDTFTATTNTLSSSVTFSLPTNVNTLILTGTAAVKGTANGGNDSLTANSGSDTLAAGSGVDTLISGATGTDSLVGGSGNDTFVVNNTADVITDTFTATTNTLVSSVSYTLPTNVNVMVLSGTAALAGTGNAHTDSITANSGADTLTAGSGVATLIGGTGNDTFVVNNTGDVVTVTATGTSDSILSSVNYVLPSNVAYLTLTGTAALTATGNSLTDLIVGNTGNDTLNGSTGIAVLEGGRTAGSDSLLATGNQAALIAGAGSSTLTGGAYKDFYAAGKVSDSITTGATANVIAVNSGDGATTIQPTASSSDILSLGAGIDTEALKFTKTGNNLVLSDGVSGDSITLTNWYAGGSDQDVTTLQVVEAASANYNSGGSDGLRNQPLEDFNFATLVSAFNTAGSPANWALSNDMASAQITSSPTQAYGGDLAYYFGLNGNLTGLQLSAAQSTLTNSVFVTAQQNIDSWSSVSGGGGLQLLIARSPLSQSNALLPAAPGSSAVAPADSNATAATSDVELSAAPIATLPMRRVPDMGLHRLIPSRTVSQSNVLLRAVPPGTEAAPEDPNATAVTDGVASSGAAGASWPINRVAGPGLRRADPGLAALMGASNFVTPTALSWAVVDHAPGNGGAGGALAEFEHEEEGWALLNTGPGVLKRRPVERGPLEIHRSA